MIVLDEKAHKQAPSRNKKNSPANRGRGEKPKRRTTKEMWTNLDYLRRSSRQRKTKHYIASVSSRNVLIMEMFIFCDESRWFPKNQDNLRPLCQHKWRRVKPCQKKKKDAWRWCSCWHLGDSREIVKRRQKTLDLSVRSRFCGDAYGHRAELLKSDLEISRQLFAWFQRLPEPENIKWISSAFTMSITLILLGTVSMIHKHFELPERS